MEPYRCLLSLGTENLWEGGESMEQINAGGTEVASETRDICFLCDAQTEIIIRPNDICRCCDSLDWFGKDA